MHFPRNALRSFQRAFRFFTAGGEGHFLTHHASRITALFLLGLMAASCTRSEPPAGLVIVNGNEPESLDPAIVTGVSEMRITKALFEGLTKLDPRTGLPIPGLAERWDRTPDGKTYTFSLRTNATWSTGEPITAHDVVWSWRRALDPATAADYAGQLFYIRGAEDYYLGKLKDPEQLGVRALDDRTVRVELNTPVAFFLDMCAFPTLAVVPRRAVEQHGERWLKARPLPASGPYELVAWRLNDRVRLRRNPRYYDAASTRTDIIDVLPTGSPNTALNLYYTGAADIIWDKDLVPSELMDELLKRPDLHTFNYLGTYFYRFNVTKKPLDDPRVRRAFALATDKPRLIQKLLKGGEKPAPHFVPDGVANYDPPSGLAFDPEAARRSLAEAGFPGGKGFPRIEYAFFAAAGGAAKQQMNLAIELQQMWRDVLGVEIELRQIERKIFYSAQSRLDYDMSASSWIGDYNDPNTFLDLFTSNSGNNRTGWKNASYDELILRANSEVDLRKRAEIFKEAETLLICEQAPVVPLYYYTGFNFYDANKIEGLWQNILDEHPMQYIGKKSLKSEVRSAKSPSAESHANGPS